MIKMISSSNFRVTCIAHGKTFLMDMYFYYFFFPCSFAMIFGFNFFFLIYNIADVAGHDCQTY